MHQPFGDELSPHYYEYYSTGVNIIEQALAQVDHFGLDVFLLRLVFGAGYEPDALDSVLEDGLAEAHEVLDLVRHADVWVLDRHGLCARKVGAQDRLVAEVWGAEEEVSALRSGAAVTRRRR